MPPYQHPYSRNLINDPMKNGCHLQRVKSGKRNGSIQSASSQASKKSCSYSHPIQKFASFLKNRNCKDIIVMAGAGISTASGIPDFRSPGTGLYYNTNKYNVAKPTDVFDLKYFNRNPNPFLDIIRDFIKSEKQPNSIHKFCKTLELHGLLLRMYTQNIDGLEKKSGISSTKLVEAHGTLESASCCKCFASHSPSWTEKMILAHKVPQCRRKGCSGYVKPDVVMFGEELPKKFYLYPKDFQKCDLLIVMGTSLNVEPFSELVDAVPRKCPRVLLNRDAVGPFADSRRKNDIFIPGDISKSLQQVVKLVGWRTSPSVEESSSSDSITPEPEEKTWASTRTFREMAIEQVPKRLEPVCLPNSVIRKSSENQLVHKMSLLSVESSKTQNSVSRRSVSAPIPKTEIGLSEQTINTVISANSGNSSEKSVSTISSHGTSIKENISSLAPSNNTETSPDFRAIPSGETSGKDCSPSINNNASTLPPKRISTRSKLSSYNARISTHVNAIPSKQKHERERSLTTLKESSSRSQLFSDSNSDSIEKELAGEEKMIKIYRTQQSDLVIPNFLPVDPRSEFDNDDSKFSIESIANFRRANVPQSTVNETLAPSPVMSFKLAEDTSQVVKDGEKTPMYRSISTPKSYSSEEPKLLTPNGVPTSVVGENDKISKFSEDRCDKMVNEMPSTYKDESSNDPVFTTMDRLSNHDNISERKSAPPGTQSSPLPGSQSNDIRYPYSSAGKRVDRKPTHAKPLYNQRKFAQLKEVSNAVSRTQKSNGITRRKVSKTQIVRERSTENEEPRSYSNFLCSETSEIFKKEFNDFLGSAKANTIKSICSKNKSSARLRSRKSGRNSILISPLSSYKKSSDAVKCKFQKDGEPEPHSPWKLSVSDQKSRQLRDLRMSGLRKSDFSKMSKKQIVLQSKPLVRFRKADRGAFQWKENQ